MHRNAKRAWIVVAIVAAGGSFAACDARMHVLDAAEQVALGAGGTRGTGGQGAGGSEGVGGAGCDVADDGGTRTGDAREVRDLTHDEAMAWCNTYLVDLSQEFGPPPYQNTPSIFPGYVVGGDTLCWNVDVCIVPPTLEDCVQNLLHAPCEATIAQLNQCVANFFGDFNEQTCGAGCEAFMKAPHCSETIVSKIGPPVADGAGGADECYLRTSKGCR
jgi:hypothetical protein